MGIRTNMRSVDLQEVEERLEDNVRQAQKFGRRAVRTYAGLWGMAYDEAMMMVDRGMNLFDRAEDRGQALESAAGDGFGQLRQQAGRRLDGLQSRVRRDVRRSGEEVEDEIEGRIERVLKRLDVPRRAQIVELGQKIDALSGEIERALAARRELPIPGYDTLTVKEVEPLLAALSANELTDLALYEATNENRVTLLRAIEDELEARRKEITD